MADSAPEAPPRDDSRRTAGNADVAGRIAALCAKIEKKLVSLKNGNSAQSACLLLKELRTYIHISAEYRMRVMESGFIEKLICLLSRCLDHRVLLSDCMRCLTPFTRAAASKKDCGELMCRYQLIKLLLVMLRRYGEDGNICTQCTELVYTIIDHYCRFGLDVGSLVNFIIMHGGVSSLPQLVIHFEEQKDEISLRRAVSCLIFVIKNSTDAASVAAKIGAGCSYAIAGPLVRVVSSRQDIVRTHALILLIGLMHGSDGIVASVIKQKALYSFEPVPQDQDGLPAMWLLSARTRCESLGVDASVLAQSPEFRTESSAASLQAHDDTSSPGALLLSGKYNHDGYWPPLRPDSSHRSGRRRPATGYDEKIPGVVDRLFASPIARGTTAKEIKRVKASLNKRTTAPSRPHTTSQPVTSYLGPSLGPALQESGLGGLDTVANTIFSENDTSSSSPVKPKHIEKLSYAEKLQAMIMQVQDTIDGEEK